MLLDTHIMICREYYICRDNVTLEEELLKGVPKYSKLYSDTNQSKKRHIIGILRKKQIGKNMKNILLFQTFRTSDSKRVSLIYFCYMPAGKNLSQFQNTTFLLDEKQISTDF